MLNLTASDLADSRADLERQAALILGTILFSFSRLDMNLGLMIVELRRYSVAPGNIEDVPEMNFHSRLQVIEKLIGDSGELAQEARSELAAWVAEAHMARSRRNALVHGRWAVDPLKNKALNIVGLPSSSAQATTEYSISELESFNSEIKSLCSRLGTLRQRWHLP